MSGLSAPASRRVRGTRVSIVLFVVAALMSFWVSFSLAAQPFEVSIDKPVAVDGHTVTMTGTADSPSKADHHLVVEWGDGNTDTLPDFDGDAPWTWGPLQHTYEAAGSYTITVTVIHAQDSGNDRNSASDTAAVDIRDPEPTPDPEPPVVETTVEPQAEVKGQTFRRPAKLAKTGPESTAFAILGIVFLLAGATLYLLSFNEPETLLVERSSY